MEGGVPPRYRHDRRAEPFTAVVEAEPPGEQAVAVAVVEDVAGFHAGQGQGSSVAFRPEGQVGAGVGDDGRLPAGARAGMEADHLVDRDGDHSQGVGVSEVLFGGERKAPDVDDRGDGLRVDIGQLLSPRLVGALGQAADQGGQAVGLKTGLLFGTRTDDVDRPVGSRAAVHRGTLVSGGRRASSAGNSGFSSPRRGPGVKVAGMDTTPVIRRFPG